MTRSQRAAALALSLGLACLAWLGLSSELTRPELASAGSATPRASVAPVQAPGPAPDSAPARGPAVERAPEVVLEHHEPTTPAASVPTSPRAPLEPSPAVPSGAETAPPPRTASSWVVPMELGWEGARVEQPIRAEIGFRVPRGHRSDALFEARISDAEGGLFSCMLPVGGLIPLELADGRELHAIGDELLVAQAPVLLRLPDLPFPVQVELLRPDGHLAATLLLSEVKGEVRAEVQ